MEVTFELLRNVSGQAEGNMSGQAEGNKEQVELITKGIRTLSHIKWNAKKFQNGCTRRGTQRGPNPLEIQDP